MERNSLTIFVAKKKKKNFHKNYREKCSVAYSFPFRYRF
jgi:hypothetical protein